MEGFVHDVLIRIATNLGDRIGGPLTFRLVLQPTIATVLAVIAGLRDAKLGKPPYFWALLSDPAHRSEMFNDGWKSVGKVFTFAFILDVVYQIIELRFVYPGEALIVAVVLAIFPYLLFRGLVTRIFARNTH